MTTPVDRDDDDALDARYRRASARAPASPSDAVRAAILAEGRRVAAEQRQAAAPARFDTQRPAANDRDWTRAAIGTLLAAAIAGLIVVPMYREAAVGPGGAPVSVADGIDSAARREATAELAPARAPLTRPSASEPPAGAPAAPPIVVAPPAALAFAPRAAPRREPAAAAPEAAAEDAAPPALEAKAQARAIAPQAPAAFAGGSVSAAAPARALSGNHPIAALAAKDVAADPAQELRTAVAAGDVGRLEALLAAGAPLAAAGADGRTPLSLATTLGNAEVVALLLAHGADPNAADRDGRTPLAAARARHLDAIATLLERAGAR